MKKLTQEEVKLQILNGIINPIYTNNGARALRANEIRSYTIEPNKISGIFVAEQMQNGFVKEQLFDFDLTRRQGGGDWQLTYDYHVAKNAKLHYFPENMKRQTSRYYRESNTALSESGVLTRPALLMVEGTATDSTGRQATYTKELIDAIAEASNNYCASNEIKLFNDHEYSQESRIGVVTGKFSAREITALDIPEGGDRSVIGSYGLFNDAIEIRDEDAIEQYHSGLLKELSVGIDLKGSAFGKNVIYEVSAVPFPAIEAAHIYSKSMDETSKYAFSFEAEMRKSSKQPSDEQMMAMDKTWSGFYAFSNLMYELQNATDSELPKPRSKMAKKAIDDLVGYLYSIHLPKPDPETVPIVMMEKQMTEQTATYAASDISQLQAEIAQLKKTNQDTLKFSALKDKAIALVNSGKLSPAEYKAKFEGEKAFANYQAAIAGDPLESFLNYVDAHVTADPRLAPSVYGATPLANQDVPERPEAEQKAIKERAAAIQASKVSY